MFSCLRNTVFQTLRNINGGGGRGDHIRTPFLCFLQNPSFLTPNRSISSTSVNPNSSSFVVSYLVNTCGLSEDKAISVSKIINFVTSSRPDSVLTFLETNGFTKPHISKLITSYPPLLLADIDKTLKPKLEFFNSIGLSGLDLAKFLSNASNILGRSLEKHIIPNFAFLKTILHSDKNVIVVLKRSTWVLLEDPEKKMVPNIGVLRDQRVPESNIKTLLKTQPRVLQMSVVRFQEIVWEVNSMGFNPLEYKFILAIHALASMSKSTWEAKLNAYRSCGWSEDEIRSAFKKYPGCMTASEKKINALMDFFVNQMGYKPSFLAEHPHLFTYSLEKRIIPRCRFIRILVSKGLLKDNFRLTSILTIAEKSFIKKYVNKYEVEVPQLRKVYQGQLDYLELPITSERVDEMNML